MSELRQDPTTKEWVIMAPERAKRPGSAPRREPRKLPEWDASCPFCPGNEAKTPAEILRYPQGRPELPWQVRVMPNAHPALEMSRSSERKEEGHFCRKMDGVGAHEVIVENPSHNTPMALMTDAQVEQVLLAYWSRYNALKENRLLKFIAIFKNQGRVSGTSLEHPHSQLVATPIIPQHYRMRFEVAMEHYGDTGHCLYCELFRSELEAGVRVVAESDGFVVFHPYASASSFETWIGPKVHRASFGMVSPEQLPELARVLKGTLRSLYRALSNPDFNYMVCTATTVDEEDPYYHWHIKIIPRLTFIAGLEMGSGIYVNTVLPEEAAAYMRKASIGPGL